MSSPRPRLRLQIAQSETEWPADTQVLIRQQMGWVILVGAFLALLCIPPFRRTLVTQARAAWVYRQPAWAEHDTEHRRKLAAVLAGTPEELSLHLGCLPAGGIDTNTPSATEIYGNGPATEEASRRDPWIRHYESVVDRFPAEPAALAACLRAYALRVVKIHRPEHDVVQDPKMPPRYLELALLKRFENFARRGQKTDPENGYFPTMLAVAQVAAGQDEAALASLAAASRCSVWHDYAYLEGYGARDLLIRAYGDHGLAMHVTAPFGILLPHFTLIRSTVRVARSLANENAKTGNSTAEHAIRANLIRLGSVIRNSGDTLIGRLVGNQIREIGFRAWKKETPGHRASSSREAASLAEFTAYARAVSREAPHLATQVEADLVDFRDHPVAQEATHLTRPYTGLLASAQLREMLSLLLLHQAGIALALWMLAALLAATAARIASLRGPRKAGGQQWSDYPVLTRVLLLGVGVLPFLYSLVVGMFEVTGSIALGIAALLLTRRLARGKDLPWSRAQVGLITLLGVVAATAGVLASKQPITQTWGHVTPLTGYLSVEGGMHAFDEGAWADLAWPLPLALTVLVLVTGFLRGASTVSLCEGVRVVAKACSAILVTAYLATLLWTVPADRTTMHTFDQLLDREIHREVSLR